MSIQDKKNPWMMSTMLLLGVIIGFGVGRIIPMGEVRNNIISKGQDQIQPQNTNENTNPGGTNTDPNNGNTTTPPSNVYQPPSITNVGIDYSKLPKALTKDGNWSLGSSKAKVVIQDLSDFQCPFCQRYFSDTFEQILNNYIAGGKVQYSFYHIPLGKHPQAQKASEASLCAGEQNKFWEMHDLLFANQDSWSFKDTDIKTYQDLAQGLKLNMENFNKCLQSGKHAPQIQKDQSFAEANGVNGTPTFIINGTKIVGAQPYAEFQKIIEAELKK